MLSMLEKEIGDVDSYTNPLLRQEGPHVPIDGKLHAAGDREGLVDTQCGWTEKELMRLRTGHGDAIHQQSAVPLPGEFPEDPPIPEGIIFSQSARLDETVREGARHARFVPLHEARERTS